MNEIESNLQAAAVDAAYNAGYQDACDTIGCKIARIQWFNPATHEALSNIIKEVSAE